MLIQVIERACSPRCYRLGSLLGEVVSPDECMVYCCKILKVVFEHLPAIWTSEDTEEDVGSYENRETHDKSQVDVQEQVKFSILPPDYTSLHQLLDLSIIAALKQNYREPTHKNNSR